jgi:transposase-like protein
MNDNRDLRSRLVAGQKRDGRREFNEDAVRELVALCLKPGVSIARMAMDHGVNPNQSRRWIARYQQQILHGPRHPEPMVIDAASGMVNTGSALAAIISPVAGGFLIDYFGNWELPFVGSMLLMAIGVVLAFRMQPESRFELSAAPDARPASEVRA